MIARTAFSSDRYIERYLLVVPAFQGKVGRWNGSGLSSQSSLPICSGRCRGAGQRRWGACYLRALMLDGWRKSVQPMAERLPDGTCRPCSSS
ncbi:transposase [Streptomyces sp. CNZ748]|uniref:transposase n=1 Tax=Streptomyces sp. CNZ748 TaxID=2885160 RepID=UPI0035A851B1